MKIAEEKLEQGEVVEATTAISLIVKFLDCYEGKKTLPRMIHNYGCMKFLIIHKSKQDSREVTASYLMPVYALRQKIAHEFEIGMNEFVILLNSQNGQQNIEPDHFDDDQIKDLFSFH